ncbi:multiple sugar transport system permease protein [Scopulibacillus darangshiensis]|uniref:Multiple sugar transport system permease protein n=1 Tax=Scopulibacillus darangshiensis TaxID=442528 RepID=A0A4R2PAM9_9BACL|nr:carbohydrate ABC transporter permease [Scopulibacillus darangshiensis]TCP30955.1 multiple sugar transport system permease protein [Scopulibacillus darangshiensis]
MSYYKRKRFYATIFATIIALFFVVPAIWIILTAFKTDAEALRGGVNFWPDHFTFKNFMYLFSSENYEVAVFRWLGNSLFVSVVGTVLVIIIDTMAAFALARLNVPFKKIILGLILISMLIPNVITLLPQFLNFANAGLLNTYGVMILPVTSSTFGVFLLYQFLKKFPVEIEESAVLDGASTWKIFLHIVVPNSKPMIVTLGIITFIGLYNDFLWPLITINQNSMKTITVGVANMMTGSLSISYGRLMALSLLSSIPMIIVFIISQKQIVKSITHTGIK